MQSLLHHLTLVSLWAFCLLHSSFGFVVQPTHTHRQKAPPRSSALHGSSSASLSELFPVLSQIQGTNWEGTCRYVNTDLQLMSNLKLTGGTRYDLEKEGECTMTSFLSFPDGRIRQVQMKGTKISSRPNCNMRLNPTEEGPVYMVVTELEPDTVLLNEVDRKSGKIIMTSSLSVVNGGKELVQISHEVGDGSVPIEGHQIWRMKKSRKVYNSTNDGGEEGKESSFRDATGR